MEIWTSLPDSPYVTITLSAMSAVWSFLTGPVTPLGAILSAFVGAIAGTVGTNCTTRSREAEKAKREAEAIRKVLLTEIDVNLAHAKNAMCLFSNISDVHQLSINLSPLTLWHCSVFNSFLNKLPGILDESKLRDTYIFYQYVTDMIDRYSRLATSGEIDYKERLIHLELLRNSIDRLWALGNPLRDTPPITLDSQWFCQSFARPLIGEETHDT